MYGKGAAFSEGPGERGAVWQLSEETNFDNSSTQKKIYDIIKSGTEDEDGKSFDQRFRDVQKACREMSQRDALAFRSGSASLDERVRAGLQVLFRRRVRTGSSSNRYGNEFNLTSRDGNKFKVVTVDATSDEQCSETIQKGLEKFHSSKSETEYIQRMKEAFPYAFKD